MGTEDVSNRIAWVRAAMAQHEGPLVRYTQRIVGDLERARDVVQETFLALWQADRRTVEGHVAEWLYTVARNRALDVKRKERRMHPVEGPVAESAPGPEPTPSEALERTETARAVLAAMGSLPEREQEVVRLKFESGLSYREIAAVTGLSVSNVGYLIHVAVKALREQVEAARSTVIPSRRRA